MFLCRTGAWILSKRTNRVVAAVNARRDEIACGGGRPCEALQVCARHLAHARIRRSLGSPGVDPNRWRIFENRDWSSRSRSILRRDGRSRRKLVRRLSSPSAVLFRHHLRQLLSLVDQAAIVNPKTLAQPRQDRHLPDYWRRGHFCYLQFDQNQAAALHVTGVSITFASSRAALGRPPAISEAMCHCRRVDLSRGCSFRCAYRQAIFSSRAAFATIARSAATGNGIRCRRFSGAEFSLVFSFTGEGLDDAAEFSERGTIHGKRRSALCHSTDAASSKSISDSARNLENFLHVGFQRR